ncbi:MAG: hypothetical protein EAZ24_15230 [Burkholderiales bacterium]|nr:MAG: hypothetical protein EAZ24_15230 [Burkholderiales bacterium]
MRSSVFQSVVREVRGCFLTLTTLIWRIYADYFLWIRERLMFQSVGHKWPARFFDTDYTDDVS